MKMKKIAKTICRIQYYILIRKKQEMSQINQDSTLRSQKKKSKIKQSELKEITNIEQKSIKLKRGKQQKKLMKPKAGSLQRSIRLMNIQQE